MSPWTGGDIKSIREDILKQPYDSNPPEGHPSRKVRFCPSEISEGLQRHPSCPHLQYILLWQYATRPLIPCLDARRARAAAHAMHGQTKPYCSHQPICRSRAETASICEIDMLWITCRSSRLSTIRSLTSHSAQCPTSGVLTAQALRLAHMPSAGTFTRDRTSQRTIWHARIGLLPIPIRIGELTEVLPHIKKHQGQFGHQRQEHRVQSMTWPLLQLVSWRVDGLWHAVSTWGCQSGDRADRVCNARVQHWSLPGCGLCALGCPHARSAPLLSGVLMPSI